MDRVTGGLRRWADQAFTRAATLNRRNIHELLAADPGGVLIDLGCDDGRHTVDFGVQAQARAVHGLDVDAARAAHANARGVLACSSDLDERFPFADGSFDIVCSNQVIEHVADSDHFVAETQRILRPGGYALTSTENLASWHNIGALFFGWQPFSLTNVSGTQRTIGNPVALHRGGATLPDAWQHRRVFSYQGLIDLYRAHGFEVEAVVGAGYYPFGSGMARRDPRHAAFLTVKARRTGR